MFKRSRCTSWYKTPNKLSSCLVTCMYGVPSSHQGTSGWRTHRLYIVVVQYDALSCQSVDVWSMNNRSLKSHITPTQIINYSQYYVRRLGAICCLQNDSNKKESKPEKAKHRLFITEIWNTLDLCISGKWSQARNTWLPCDSFYLSLRTTLIFGIIWQTERNFCLLS